MVNFILKLVRLLLKLFKRNKQSKEDITFDYFPESHMCKCNANPLKDEHNVRKKSNKELKSTKKSNKNKSKKKKE